MNSFYAVLEKIQKIKKFRQSENDREATTKRKAI
jgi:hypothetical protein